LLEAQALLSPVSRLPGVDGRSKMSKSSGNAITLSASDAEIKDAVNRMYTDPNHLRASDPGRVEGNVVFLYLDAFDPDQDAVSDLKAEYRRGGLGDIVLKRRLERVLCELIGPIRERRATIAGRPDVVHAILRTGTQRARELTAKTMEELRDGLVRTGAVCVARQSGLESCCLIDRCSRAACSLPHVNVPVHPSGSLKDCSLFDARRRRLSHRTSGTGSPSRCPGIGRHAQGGSRARSGTGATRSPFWGEHGEDPPLDATEHGGIYRRADGARRNRPGRDLSRPIRPSDLIPVL
jgi:tRNA synthetases class I (W and Y)